MNNFPSLKKTKLPIIILVGLLILLIAGIITISSVPPISRDALTHHLFVLKLYIEHGGIYEIPNIPFSYYPMNLDMLYMIPLYFGNDIVPKYIHFLFALLTAGLIYSYIKNRISPIYGLLGSLFFLSIPIIVKLSSTVYVDLGLMFFSTASLLLIFRWLHSNHKIHYLIFAGICCGLAAGVKYNGLINLFLFPLFIPILYIRSKNGAKGCTGKSIKYSLLFVLATLIAFSPWLIRNHIWTDNPIYPLHNSLFNPPTKTIIHQSTTQGNTPNILQKLSSSGGNIFASRKILYHETWWQALLLPVRFFFEGQDDNPRYFDGKLNPFLLILPFFAFGRKSPSNALKLEKYSLLAFASLFFFFTFFQQTLRIRYIVSIVPALVLLSMFGLQNIVTAVSRIYSTRLRYGALIFLFCMLGGMFTYNIQYITQQFHTIRPFSYLRGEVSREQYIARFRQEYPAIQYANTGLQRDSKVLCIFLGNRGYYMNFYPVFENPAQGGLFANILRQLPSGKNIKTELLNKGINYILLRNDLTQSWHQHLTKDEQIAVASFFKHDTIRLFNQGGYSFLQIASSSLPTQQ